MAAMLNSDTQWSAQSLEKEQGPILTMSTSSRGSSPPWAPAGTASAAAGTGYWVAGHRVAGHRVAGEGIDPEDTGEDTGEGSPAEERNHCGVGKKRSVSVGRDGLHCAVARELYGQRRIGADIPLLILRHGFGGRGGVLFVGG